MVNMPWKIIKVSRKHRSIPSSGLYRTNAFPEVFRKMMSKKAKTSQRLIESNSMKTIDFKLSFWWKQFFVNRPRYPEILSRQSFGPKFWVVWPRKTPASGWGSLWESSSFVPWFSTFVFRNVPGTVPECVVICWFKRNSSNLDRAPKMRDSVRLNSWDSFLVTLPSICSETCVIYSSLILGTDVFRDWPFLGFSSCVSLKTAANFRLFINVAIFLKGKCYAVMKTKLFCICYTTWGYNKNVIL